MKAIPVKVPAIVATGNRSNRKKCFLKVSKELKSAPILTPTRNISMYRAYVLRSVSAGKKPIRLLIPRIVPAEKNNRILRLIFMIIDLFPEK